MYRRSSQFFPGVLLGAAVVIVLAIASGASDRVIGHTTHLLLDRHRAHENTAQKPCLDTCCPSNQLHP